MSIRRPPLYRALWEIIKEHKWLLVLYSTMSLLFNFFPVILPLFVKNIIDGVVAGLPFYELLPIFWMYAGVEVVRHGAFFLSDYTSLKVFMKIRNTLYEKIYTKFFSFSLGQHRSSKSGVKLSIIERGIQFFISIISDINNTALPSVVRLIGILALLAVFSLPVAMTLALLLCLHVISWKVFDKVFFRENAKKSEKMYREMEGYKHEIVGNVETVKTIGSSEREMGTLTRKLRDIYVFVMRFRIPLFTFRTIRSFLTQIVYISILLWVTWLVSQGNMTAGMIALLAQWTVTATQDIIALTGFEIRLAEARAGLEKLARVITLPSSLQGSTEKKPFPKNASVTFEAVSFRYDAWQEIDDEEETTDTSKYLFEDLSLSIQEGKTTAFVGPSGSGKSSLMRLLLRYFDPEKGTIRIGDVPLQNIDQNEYYKHVGYIPQHIELFSGTLRENILYSHPEPESISEETLMHTIKQSRISDFWYRLEQGLDTKIGEDGIKLSGGERQRVAIARALIKSPSLYIFDEATSSLDSSSESAIQETIKDISKGKTTLVIAHRLSTIVRADTIVVIEKGRVVAQGTHSELIHNSPLYYKLVKTQLQSLLEAQLGHLENDRITAIMKDLQLIS